MEHDVIGMFLPVHAVAVSSRRPDPCCCSTPTPMNGQLVRFDKLLPVGHNDRLTAYRTVSPRACPDEGVKLLEVECADLEHKAHPALDKLTVRVEFLSYPGCTHFGSIHHLTSSELPFCWHLSAVSGLQQPWPS